MRIGIDLGGTKISAVALDENGTVLQAIRTGTPRKDYAGTLATLRDLVAALESRTGLDGSVGIGMPGSLSPRTGLVQNANSTWLNGKPFRHDLEQILKRDIRLANDANCFALSEAVDGAASDARNVFGVILGTGCGGAVVLNKKLLNGPRNIAGEWGHVPLPWMQTDEFPGPLCWCGRHGCMESFVSGPALGRDYQQHNGQAMSARQIHEQALTGNKAALASLARHVSRLGRGLAMIVNILDPDIIVLGGGLSKMPHLYRQLPDAMSPFIFSQETDIRIVAPAHGDDSGVRGAAWLWDRP